MHSNSSGKNVWKQHSGRLFPCFQGKKTAIRCALGCTVIALRTTLVLKLAVSVKRMNRLHGEGDSFLPCLLLI